MFVNTIRKSVLWGVVALVLLAMPVALTTCDSPMGLGDPIDWIPPEITLDPGRNPRYVRLGTIIGGTVTDNTAVDRVIMRDAVTGEQFFTATLLPESRWEIELNFEEKNNGDKMSVEFVAYDRVGNASAVNLTIIIDLNPPTVESARIERAPGKPTVLLRRYNELRALETTDRYGEKRENVNQYQNGWFTLKARLNESETRIEKVVLDIYDYRNYETPLYSKEMDPNDGSLYSPQWVIKEEELLNAGNAIIDPNYKTNYNNGARYYYQVFISSYDKSENEGTLMEREEEQLFFCMWEQADVPKGILDPIIGNVLYKQMTLPVQLFDDDALEWAYAGLLSADQWNGVKPIDDGDVKIPQNGDKLEWLRKRLVDDKGTVYNWKYDDRYKRDETGKRSSPIISFVDKDATIDDIMVQLETGDREDDYGEYMLFTLVQDKKLTPHPAPANGAPATLNPRWKGRTYPINIIDDNLPLIVFDTSAPNMTITNADYRTGDSPEENTFPILNNNTFVINGYTLRENSTGGNEVQRFRMAWIPRKVLVQGDESAIIKEVEEALRWYRDPVESGNFKGWRPGVQFWVLDDKSYAASVDIHKNNTYTPDGGVGILTAPENQLGGEDKTINKQIFRKQFNILGGTDNLKGEYQNFTYGTGADAFENDTKVFVFCAIDNMGKAVFRTLRLLGNKTPPELNVYDITDRTPTSPELGSDIPSMPGVIDATYHGRRTTYNADNYEALKSVSGNLGENDKTAVFQSYPRGATVKYWVSAGKEGSIAIKGVTMTDVTGDAGTGLTSLGSPFKPADWALSYIERFPEVTQRVFSFTATDELGNTNTMQRTIAIISAAMLTSITTTKESGTYGIGEVITLRANFDRQIQIPAGVSFNNILLNVRLENATGQPVYRQIPLTRAQPLFLEFDFIVQEGDKGEVKTLYDLASDFPGVGAGDLSLIQRRPITLRNNARILDQERQDDAFTPGNVIGFVWLTAANSLQSGKTIQLDGIRPQILSVGVTGKTPAVSGGVSRYYFKAGESITFTIAADKPIRPSGTNLPQFQFRIRQNNGTVNPTGGGYYPNNNDTNNAFAYLRPVAGESSKMVFSLEVNSTRVRYDGQIFNFSFSTYNNSGTVADDVGNTPLPSTISEANFTTMLNTVEIYCDQTPPPAPVTTLRTTTTQTIGANPTTKIYLNAGPVLDIAAVPASEPYGATRQYSLNGGMKWVTFPTPETGWSIYDTVAGTLSLSNGDWDLMTRYVDTAGNEGAVTRQLVEINANFPKLTLVNTTQPTGTYAAGDALTFNLNFENPVRVRTVGDVTITLTNRNTPANNQHNTGGTTNSYQIQLQAAAGQTTNTTSIRFAWTLAAATKEMLNGVYISAINLSGLEDRFGNLGPNRGTVASSSGAGAADNINMGYIPATPVIANLIAGTIVDTIPPRVSSWTPAAGTDLGGTRRTISITFNEPVVAGSGTITIRPRTGNWLVPPVFENDGYYLGTDGNRYSTPQNGVVIGGVTVYTTYVDGFYDIYNNGNLVAADRQKLTESTNATSPSWGTLALNPRTGQTKGPYMRLTQGLKIGSGYTGNYSGTNVSSGANVPNPGTGGTGNDRFMVPDTATKWVLDYKLRIKDTGNSQITGIRETLTKAKFRWQEIDVINTTIPTGGSVVTITLNEPLLQGLEWEVYYPAGTFTDTAGNQAVAVTTANPHTFWTSGAQTPVIRVNRRSYDARAVGAGPNNLSGKNDDGTTNNTISTYPGTPPGTTTGWTAAAATVTDTDGWGIADFNTVHYRIETETPGAALTSGVYNDTVANRRTNRSSVTAAFTGTVHDANANNQINGQGTVNWNNDANTTNGTWILTNLIRRRNSTYEVQENGNPVERRSGGTYNGFRSYNKDATITNLNLGLATFNPTNDQGIVTFGALEAGKSYVVAIATRNGNASARGYEGIFRTVVALLNSETGVGTRPVLVEGSNIKNGMPSVAGFPVRDAEETGDTRYVKMFLRRAGNNSNAELLWVSTEIVCEWYFLKYGGRGSATHMQDGEVNNYLMVGYGDLTYGYNLRSSGE